MNFRKSACIIPFIVSALLTGAQEQKPAETQQQKDTFKFSVGTNMVLVPVVVTDGKGNHITGLKKEDFEVKEDGSSQTIVHFDELTAESAKVQVASSGETKAFSNAVNAEHPKKLEIIAVDRINTTFAESADAKRGLVDFLSKGVDSNTLLALITLDPNGINLVHNFTSDPAVLVSAVRKLQTTLTSRDTRVMSPGDTPEVDAEVLELQALFNGADLSQANTAAQAGAAVRAINLQTHALLDASRRNQNALVTLESLQQVAQYFGGVPGRKSLIWASAAFPFNLGGSARELTRGTTYDDWLRTFHALQDANIAVYPVDVSGLLPGVAGANTLQNIDSTAIKSSGPDGGVAARTQQLDAATSGAFLNPLDARHETMRQLADMTGGQAFYNSNDSARLFRNAGEDAGQYYLIGFYTKNNAKTGWRKLSVKLHNAEGKVRTRSGYYFRPSGVEPESQKTAEEMMALSSDLSFSSVPFRGTWQAPEAAGTQKRLPFVLTLPAGVALVDHEHQNHISLDFRVLVKDAGGKVAATIGQRLDTSLDQKGVEEVQTTGIDYTNRLTLDPGEYKVHFVVRDNLRGTLGSVVVPLTVQ